MYKNLNKIGLKNWLIKCCGGKLHEDRWLRNLDNFVAHLSNKNIDVIKTKFCNDLSHIQKNDLFHELEIVYVFHPKAQFLYNVSKKQPDLYDESTKTFIEIKTLNEGLDEQGRHKLDKYSCISQELLKTEKLDLKNKVLKIIENKVLYHFNKATEQLKGRGKIYLVWDFNTLVDNHPQIISIIDVQDSINNTMDIFSKNKPNITILPIYHGELRELVSNSLI